MSVRRWFEDDLNNSIWWFILLYDFKVKTISLIINVSVKYYISDTLKCYSLNESTSPMIKKVKRNCNKLEFNAEALYI